jgi:prenyltransferase beta subunit
MKKLTATILMIMISIPIITIPTKLSPSASADPQGEYPYRPTDPVITEALQYLRQQQTPDGSIGGVSVSAWAVMALSAAEQDPHEWENLVEYLRQSINTLDETTATDWERHALAIAACNENPRTFGGKDFMTTIENFYDGTQLGNQATFYDDFFGILALISCGIDQQSTIIQQERTYIRSQQEQNGGWGDVDATAAALMALVAAGEDKNSESITDAVSYIKTTQAANGGFQSWGTANAASTAWATCALTAAGQDPTDDTWRKNGNSPIDFLVRLQRTDGGFNWDSNHNMNSEWMTSYVLPALLGKPYPITIYHTNTNNENGTDTTNSTTEWTGMIRVEGKNTTLFNGTISFSNSTIHAFNESSGHMQDYYLPYPTVLGALDEASRQKHFSYYVIYYPSWDAFYVRTIADDSDWWHYWVDYFLPMIDAGHYKLTENNHTILFGYLESWDAHALQITVDKQQVNVSEEFHVHVGNETSAAVENAIVWVGSASYTTDEHGDATLQSTIPGDFLVYAEKEGYVQSEKIPVHVKKSVEITKPVDNAFYWWNTQTSLPYKGIFILGHIDVEVQASDAVQKVEFYRDGALCYTDVERPFTWRLNTRAFLKKTTIQVYGYTYAHSWLMSIYDVDEKEATLLNCFPQLHILP